MSRFSVSAPPALLVVSLACWLAAGCGTAEKPTSSAAKPAAPAEGGHDHADDHDHADESAKAGHDHAAEHDHPTTLAAGIAELEALTREVADKLAGDAQEAADDAIHAAGHVIDDVRGLLAKETITADAKEAATKALDELFECFDKLDVAMHAEAKEGAETVADIHASIAARVQEAVTALKERFPAEDK
jgi:hypothetical protein